MPPALFFPFFPFSIFSFPFTSLLSSHLLLSTLRPFSVLFYCSLSSPSRTPHQLLRILAPRGSRLQVVVWGRALRAWHSRSSEKRVPRVQNALDENSRTHHPCLFQPQVQQLLHGVGRGLHKLRAAGPDQPHGPCHWLPGGLGHWPNDLYSQW